MGTKTITKEQATEALIEERRAEMQAEVDATAEAERLENDRLESLNSLQERAAAILKERAELLPQFVESLEQVGQSATELRELRDEHTHLTARARQLGGATDTTWPKAFGIDPKERQLLREGIQALSSVGGTV